MATRPKIAIVGRFTEQASAIRSLGVVSSRRLLEAVWAAGGEPITFLPVENPNWAERLGGYQGVLIPGGGDINPKWYGEEPQTEELYGVDDLQDENDHRHYIHTVTIDKDAEGLGLSNSVLESSCFHHQAIKELGKGLEVLARADEGHVEAFKIEAKAWSYGVQWHPEDNYKSIQQQMELFTKFVSEAAKN
jgi:putative glutamine amidotransferase